ncbi:hypothetical protein EJB05_44906, partial [Eragrostis curvula]
MAAHQLVNDVIVGSKMFEEHGVAGYHLVVMSDKYSRAETGQSLPTLLLSSKEQDKRLLPASANALSRLSIL